MYQYPRQTRQFHIDTGGSTTIIQNGTYKSHIQYYLLEPLVVDNTHQFCVSLNDMQIPVSFYQITTSNNALSYKISGGSTKSITITPGNYAAADLVTYFTTATTDFTTTFDFQNYKFVFTNATLSFTFYTANTTCFSILGFSSQNQLSTLTTTNTLTSDQVCNLSGNRNIYVHTNLSTNNVDARPYGFCDILCKIPITCNPGSILFWSNFTMAKYEINDTCINSIEIYLRDDLGNVYNFNNCDWSCTIQFETFNVPDTTVPLDHNLLGVVAKQNISLNNNSEIDNGLV